MQNLAPKNEFTQFELSKKLINSKFFSKNKMSPSSRLVLIVLTSHYPNIYPSIKTIQNESGISSKTSVINSLKELSKLGFILYETKNVNHYSFTALFFESLNIEPEKSKYCNLNGSKIDNKQINQKINNKFNFYSEKKLPKYHHNTQLTGINYPKYKKSEKESKKSPLDLSKEQAADFLKNLPKNLQNTFFARELKKKWNFQ